MSKKIALLFSRYSYEIKALEKAIISKGWSVSLVKYDHIDLTTANVQSSQALNELLDSEVIFSRVSTRVEHRCDSLKRSLILRLYPDICSKMLNGKTYLHHENFSKAYQTFVLNKKGVPVPISQLRSEFSKVNYPFVLKGLWGNNGSEVFYVNSDQKYKNAIKVIGDQPYIIQEVLPGKVDYRIIVIRNKVIGGFKRFSATDGFLTNINAGGRAEKINALELKKVKDIALEATRVFECDFAGVDVMMNKNGSPVVLEVNRSPGFEMFESVTNINLANKFMEYFK